MSPQTFHMAKHLDAVDPMVVSLKGLVEGHLEGEAQFRFDICVSEALANLVQHAQTPRPDAVIEITLTAAQDQVVIEVFDPEGAAAFDLRDKARPLSEVDDLAEGGRGLGLILECADDVAYGPVGQRNRLSLSFQKRD